MVDDTITRRLSSLHLIQHKIIYSGTHASSWLFRQPSQAGSRLVRVGMPRGLHHLPHCQIEKS